MLLMWGGSGNNAPSFSLQAQSSLVPEASQGSSTPTYTRASTAYQIDFEGKANPVPSGCARFQGARFVYNLCPTPSTSIAIAGNKTITVGVGTFVFSMGAEATGTCVITFTGTATGSTGTLTANATSRTAKTLTITVGGTIIATCTVAAASDIQFEDVTGQANQNASSYVSVGVLSAPFHGAGVDAVCFHDRPGYPTGACTLNGNTTASGVLTEATGAAINSSNAKFAALPGTSGAYFSTPDSVPASITGDIDIRVKVALMDWTPASTKSFVSKLQSLGQYSWQFTITSTNNNGFLSLWQSLNGSTYAANESSVGTGFADGTTHWVRVARVAATGIITYYTSEDGQTWTQLGTTVAGSAGNMYDGTSVMEVGSHLGGTGNTAVCRIYRAQVYNGIGGTLAVDFNPNDWSTGGTFASATTGETWTINGSAAIYNATFDSGGPYGYLSEGARADVLGTTAAIRRTMTDVGWVSGGGGITVSAATGMDGVASAGARLTAAGANGTILFTTVLASAARTYYFWAKRVTGTGNVDITDNNGTNWTTLTLTANWTLFQVTRTQANPIVGIRIVTSGNAVEVDFNTIEAAAFANPTEIPVNVSKVADVEQYVSASNISAAATTLYMELAPAGSLGSATVFHFGTYVDANNYTALLSDGTNLIARKRIASVNTDATIAFTRTVGTVVKCAARFDTTNGIDVFLSGTKGTGSATLTASQIGTNFQFGADGNGANQDFCARRNVKAYTTSLSDASLQAMTA